MRRSNGAMGRAYAVNVGHGQGRAVFRQGRHVACRVTELRDATARGREARLLCGGWDEATMRKE